MPAALIALLTALPDLLKLLEQLGPELGTLIRALVAWINHVSGNDPQGFIKRVGVAFSALERAQTEEERQDAAQKLANLLHSLP